MNILGINFGHYGSCAIIKEGILASVIASERIFQSKNMTGIARICIGIRITVKLDLAH